MTLNLVIGVVVGIFYCILVDPAYYTKIGVQPFLIDSFAGIEYIPIFLFGLTAGFIFSYAGVLGVRSVEKIKALKSLAGSIAHELRNPLSAIRSSASIIDVNPKNADVNELNKMSKEQLVELLSNDTKEILEHKSHLNKSVNLANSIIDMTLADLSGKKISESDFTYINSSKIINEAIDLYAFKSVSERERVKINSDVINSINDSKNNPIFIFKGIETAFYYIFFNLIKNALYYAKDRVDLTITISSSNVLGKDILDQAKNNIYSSNHLKLKPEINYNIIHIHDTGPGIAPEVLQKLFGDFVTSGKSEGTGLGLAFCKRTMIDFGGDINCESEFGSWTRFNLYFPQLSDDELKKAQEQINQDNIKLSANDIANSNDSNLALNSKSHNKSLPNINGQFLKKVLVVDDQELNLRISTKLIKSLLSNVIINTALDGKQALKLIKNNQDEDISSPAKKYDLIIVDIQMKIMDGFELAKEIRKFDKHTPITAYTSRTSYKIKQQAIDIGIDDYIIKPIPNNALFKTIYKWLSNDHVYNYNIGDILDSFKDLKILIADDEAINIMVLKKFLSKYGFIVETANDGNELLEKYTKQFPEHDLKELERKKIIYNPANKYDIIIADINMPNKKGDAAVKEIRDYELIHNVKNKAIIIANSGDSDKKKLKAMLKSGMDDYFIKGEDNNKLLKIIYFWISHLKANPDPSYLNIDNKYYAAKDAKKNNKIINSKLTNEDLKELKDLFIASTKDLLNKIKQATKNNDVEEINFQSHALKGISGNVGAEKLFIYISMINNYAKQDKWPQEEDWLKELEDICKITNSKIEEL